MDLIIDVRERHLIEALQDDTQFTSRQLDLGDVHICDGDTVSCIIERKTIADLAASIKDGRYHEQKMRLVSQRSTSSVKLVYIIEGSMSFNESGMQYGVLKKALVSCLINSSLRDGVTIFKSQGILDTCDIIKAMLARPETIRSQGHKLDADTYTDACIKPKKRENVTQRTILLHQLTAIPGISVKKATNIIDELQVTSIIQLCRKFHDKDDCSKQLLGIKGIGKILASQVAEALMA